MVNGSFTDASASEGGGCLQTDLVRRRGIGYSGRRLINRRRLHLSESVEDRAEPPEGWPGKPAAARIPLAARPVRLDHGAGGGALCALDAGADRVRRELGVPDPAGRAADPDGARDARSRLADRRASARSPRSRAAFSATPSARSCSRPSAGRSSSSTATSSSSPSSGRATTSGAPGSCSSPG